MRVPILTYHRVGPRAPGFQECWTVTPERFAQQMAELARSGWQGISLDALLDGDLARRFRRPVVLTFDDGYAANREHAWPELRRHGFGATTLLVADRFGATNTWDGPAEPTYPLLDLEALSTVPSGMTFGCHSATHADVTRLPDARLEHEVGRARAHLEATLRRPVLHFAYPFGTWSWRVASAVQRAGFLTALSCIGGLNTARTSTFLLRRVEVRDEDPGWRLRFKLLTGRDPLRRPVLPPSEAQLAAVIRREGLPPASLRGQTLARARAIARTSSW